MCRALIMGRVFHWCPAPQHLPMNDHDPVSELVLRWQESRQRGLDICIEELCVGRPELLGEVQLRLNALAEMERLLATGALESTPSHTDAQEDAHTSAMAVALRPPQGRDELGRLGGYRVLRLLGQGGMGAVFLAEDLHLERHIALKVMGPGLAAKPDARRRFLREAKATAKLKNDHVVAIYQVGEDNGVPFLAMEYLEGEPLDSRLRRCEKMPLDELLQIGREVAQGLAAAHAKGLVHRDIKPANIWLEKIGNPQFRVKILDFGLARGGVEEVQITQSGAILGTPAYMAPEQARGETADSRSDLFSLGCVLYRLCTGKTPFEGPTIMSVLTALATQDPAPVAQLNRDIPEVLAGLVMRLLAKRPEDRPASAQAVLDELRAIEPRAAQESKESNAPALTAKTSPALSAPPTPTPQPPAYKQSQVQPRRSRHWLVVAAALLGVAAIIGLGEVIIRIRGRDGKLTEPYLPDRSKVSSNDKGELNVKLPGAGEKLQAAPHLNQLGPKADFKRLVWKPLVRSVDDLVEGKTTGKSSAERSVRFQDGTLELRGKGAGFYPKFTGKNYIVRAHILQPASVSVSVRRQNDTFTGYEAVFVSRERRLDLPAYTLVSHPVGAPFQHLAGTMQLVHDEFPVEFAVSAYGREIAIYVNGKRVVVHSASKAAEGGIAIHMNDDGKAMLRDVEVCVLDGTNLRPDDMYSQQIDPDDQRLLSPELVRADLKKGNLLKNPSFENLDSSSWSVKSLLRGNKNACTAVTDKTQGGRSLLLIQNDQTDDVVFKQVVTVKPKTRYLLSGWIKTESVEPAARHNGFGGAGLYVFGGHELTTPSLLGSKDWTYAAVVFRSGNRTSVEIAARLGYFAAPVAGKAWFDDLCLVELPDAPAVTPRSPQKRKPP